MFPKNKPKILKITEHQLNWLKYSLKNKLVGIEVQVYYGHYIQAWEELKKLLKDFEIMFPFKYGSEMKDDEDHFYGFNIKEMERVAQEFWKEKENPSMREGK